jgi:hypothetical protein
MLTLAAGPCIKCLQMSITQDQLQAERTGHKYDTLNLIVLILVACVLGIYLIATTVLISKDGVLYVEQAKLYSSDAGAVISKDTPGYPFLIFSAHKFAGIFGDNSSLFGWIHAAQGVTLLFRLLGLLPLYLIGKRLVGARDSFYAILILILLPHPAKMSCDLTREWPYVLFLATGFLLLLWGAASAGWRTFGAVGLAAGLAHIIRPEGAQLVAFGVLWLLLKLTRPGRDMTRARVVLALVALLIGFAIPVAPYAKARGKIMPDKMREFLLTSSESPHRRPAWGDSDSHPGACETAGLVSGVGEAAYELCERVNENLLYFFVPPMLIGIYSQFRGRQKARNTDRFFVSAFVAFNVAMPILLYQNYHYMSRRHALPLILVGVFYVPWGLRAISDRLEREIFRNQPPTNKNSLRWFTILLIIGIAVCLPKLLEPAGADKQGYRDAAEWLKKSSDAEAVIAAADPRIGFYAERKRLMLENDVTEGADYVVKVLGSSGEPANLTRGAQEVYSVSVSGSRKGDKKVVIYKMMRPNAEVRSGSPTLSSEDGGDRQQ